MLDYRLISVLPSLSKAIEIIMKRQINALLMDRGFLNNYQSGFRTHHSTSTALLKVTNDLLIATDKRLVSLLVLLDFSKAFDSVNDHQCVPSSMLINDIVFQITSCHVHFYADDVQIYISCEPHHIENCIHNMIWTSTEFTNGLSRTVWS
jgi:hypothetical protein